VVTGKDGISIDVNLTTMDTILTVVAHASYGNIVNFSYQKRWSLSIGELGIACMHLHVFCILNTIYMRGAIMVVIVW